MKGALNMEQMCSIIQEVVSDITELIQPQKIILFSRKFNFSGETSSFKLCVITQGCDPGDRRAATQRIYLDVNCAVPFDIVVYNAKQWEDALANTASFAYRVNESGSVVYEQKKA